MDRHCVVKIAIIGRDVESFHLCVLHTVYIQYILVDDSIGRINKVNRRRAQLVLGLVTVCRRVNHLGM